MDITNDGAHYLQAETSFFLVAVHLHGCRSSWHPRALSSDANAFAELLTPRCEYFGRVLQ
eukprot:scaffold666612_cov57-Prasinocladus_malaysianus.AAC.1